MHKSFFRTVLSLGLTLAFAVALGPVAGCKKSSVTAGGTNKDKGGPNLVMDKSMGTNEGATYDSATCDASLEGEAWCTSGTQALICAGGTFYLVDCTAFGFAECGEDDSGTADCYAAQ